jgi:hypothetical protein
MVCFVNAFAKLSTAKSASIDDIRKGNLRNEKIIFVKKGLRKDYFREKRASQTN